MTLVAHRAIAYEKVTISTDAVSLIDLGFDEDDVNQADSVFISVEEDDVRYRFDGGDPAADDGHPILADGERTIVGNPNIRRLKLIAVTTDATAYITLGKL